MNVTQRQVGVTPTFQPDTYMIHCPPRSIQVELEALLTAEAITMLGFSDPLDICFPLEEEEAGVKEAVISGVSLSSVQEQGDDIGMFITKLYFNANDTYIAFQEKVDPVKHQLMKDNLDHLDMIFTEQEGE